MSVLQPQFLTVGAGEAARQIAMLVRPARADRDLPALVWLSGYRSDMSGSKAVEIDRLAEELGTACIRLDYSGHGLSSGAFTDGTISRWLEEALAVIRDAAPKRMILIGSSMGGWIALHLALLRGEHVRALVGIAAAPDFTAWGFDNGQAAERQGVGRAFWESGQQLRLLDKEIGIDCPVRLIHGEKDQDVPLDVAFRTMHALRSADVQLNVLKGGGHRLSEPHEIDAILRTVDGLLEPAP